MKNSGTAVIKNSQEILATFRKQVGGLMAGGMELEKACYKVAGEIFAQYIPGTGEYGIMAGMIIKEAQWHHHGYDVVKNYVVQHGRRYINLYPLFPERMRDITIAKPRSAEDSYAGKPTPAEVNFPTFGSQPPEKVAAFANAMLVAAQIAMDLNAGEGK